jgi:hypothetical protein
MALERFIPKSPDINIRNSQDFEVAKFGHLNTIVEYINNNTVQPAGLNGYVQFNDNAALGGDAGLFWDNTNKYLGIGTTTPIGILHLYKSAATTRMVMDGDAGQSKIITYRTGGLQRFGLYVNNTAESGSNAGSNFAIRAYSDAGTLLNTPVFIKRSTGNVGVNTLTGTAKLQVVGSGSTSATTALLVQNSGATRLLQVTDDGILYLGTTASGLGSIYVPRSSTYGNRNFLFNQDGNALMYTISNDLIGFNTTVFFNADVAVAGNYRTTLKLTKNLSAASSTDSLIINSGTTWNTQANGTCIGINLQPVIDTDASSFSAKYIGFYWNPNLADLQSATHYGIQTTSGGAYINTATPNASAALQADSTTQGFLPPRMTTAQINAIATPAEGLIAFNTTISHLCCYQAGAWVKFNHSPM